MTLISLHKFSSLAPFSSALGMVDSIYPMGVVKSIKFDIFVIPYQGLTNADRPNPCSGYYTHGALRPNELWLY